MNKSVKIVMIIAILFLSISVAQAGDWRMFHHDARHTGYTNESISDELELLWSYKTGVYVYSSPTVADGKVFIGSGDHNIYCLDEDTGKLIWSYKTGDYVRSSPAVADGKVLVGSEDAKIYCLDEDTGKLIWSYETGSYVYSSPVVADGKVLVGSNDAKIYCFGSVIMPTPTTSAPDWKYYKEIIIKENSGKMLMDYQVLVELKGDDFPSKAKTDGADIRFTDANGKELSYWIESWDYSGKSAKIWVKVPRIPANVETKITMRYGNPNASPQSDGDATFEFFDDFDYSEPKADWKWNQGESKRSTYKISNSKIGIYNFGINDPWEYDSWTEAAVLYTTIPSKLTDYVIEAKTETDAISGDIDTFQTGVAILSSVGDNDWYAVGYLRDTVEKETGAPYHILCVEGCKDGHCIENDLLETNSDEKIWFRIDVIGKDFKWYWKHDIEDKWSYRGQYRDKFIPENFGIWVKNWGDNSKYKIWVDYIFLHKYTAPEPTITIGAEQPRPTITPVPTTPTPTPTPITFTSAKAAIEEAKTKISEANSRGSDLTQAELLLEEAEHALGNGDYNKAIEFAEQAKEMAEMAIMAHYTLTATVIGVVIFIVVSVVRILRKK